MNDRYYMQSLLTCAKSMCGLLLHGTVESSTPNVNTTMNQALFDFILIKYIFLSCKVKCNILNMLDCYL